MDLQGVMKTATECDVDWAVVAQGRVDKWSPLESIQASLWDLKEWGWL